MRFCSFREYGAIATGYVQDDRVVGLDDLNDALSTDFGPDLDELLRRGQVDDFRNALSSPRHPTSGWKAQNLRYAPPIARPGKIWGVGLNFKTHAADLNADGGDSPAAWMRPASTLAGAGDAIELPEGVGRVTAEAEIAIVIGKAGRKLESDKAARDIVFGFMPVLDLTAEELLRKNARYLTQAKSYDGFCAIGPFITSVDEWEPTPTTKISTIVDGERREGTVSQMRHSPYELVRHFSHVFTWQPGDILLTGTPGAIAVKNGSAMRAEIAGLPALEARVQ